MQISRVMAILILEEPMPQNPSNQRAALSTPSIRYSSARAKFHNNNYCRMDTEARGDKTREYLAMKFAHFKEKERRGDFMNIDKLIPSMITIIIEIIDFYLCNSLNKFL